MKLDVNGNYICETCGNVLILDYMYDSYFCESCDAWAEKKCDDEHCVFCIDRPDKPSEI